MQSDPCRRISMLLTGPIFLAINTCKCVPILASQGQSIHHNNPLYNRVAGGISDVVGLKGRLKMRLELRLIRELMLTSNRELGVSTTNGLARAFVRGRFGRLVRRLNLTRSLVGGLVVRELLFARGLVGRSFVNQTTIVIGFIVELVVGLIGF